MPVNRHIYHPLQSDFAHIDMARDTIRKALQVLRQSQPDTFLGRETYRPFPMEALAINIGDGTGNSPQP